MSMTQKSPHQWAGATYKKQFSKVLLMLLVQLLIRALAFSPLLYAAISGGFFGAHRDHILAVAFLCSLPLYVLLVLPARFYWTAQVARLRGQAHDDQPSFCNCVKWLKAGLYRLLRALPFLLPFFAFLGVYYYYLRMTGFNEPMVKIKQIGELVGGEYTAGIVIIMLLGLVTLLLALWGWLRGTVFEHQEVTTSPLSLAWQTANEVRKDRKAHLRRVTFQNFLLTLPAVVGLLAVIALFFMTVKSGTLIFDFLYMGSVLLTFNFPSHVMLQGLLVLLLLYLPLLPLRKLALAAAIFPTAKKDEHAA